MNIEYAYGNFTWCGNYHQSGYFMTNDQKQQVYGNTEKKMIKITFDINPILYDNIK